MPEVHDWHCQLAGASQTRVLLGSSEAVACCQVGLLGKESFQSAVGPEVYERRGARVVVLFGPAHGVGGKNASVVGDHSVEELVNGYVGARHEIHGILPSKRSQVRHRAYSQSLFQDGRQQRRILRGPTSHEHPQSAGVLASESELQQPWQVPPNALASIKSFR